MKTVVTPYGVEEGSKKQQVERMFDAIAPSYDRLNRILSLGIDITWRRKAVRLLKPYKPQIIVDIATGTGDFALEAVKLKPTKIIGLDISEGMLALGREKMKRRKLDSLIEMRTGDAENLPIETDTVGAITIGFGVRNFEHLEKGLAEVLRILKPSGVCVILEPGFPTSPVIGGMYKWYFGRVLPWLGSLISNNREAYGYLCESVSAFPNGPDFVNICRTVGFVNVQWKPLTFGICSLYLLEKPQP